MIRVEPHLTREQLEQHAAREQRANVRDRLRAVLWVLDGDSPADIAPRLGRLERWVWTWLARYNAGGPDGLAPRPGRGRHRLIDPQGEAKLRGLVEKRAADPRRARRLRGLDVVEFAKNELGVKMSLAAAYNTLHRLGYEPLRPRPRHEENDPEKMARWLENDAPLLSARRAKTTPVKPSKSGSRTKRASVRKAP